MRHPNIIFILCDDLGWGDLGCYGQKTLKTPNLDKLASEGVRFTDFYTTSPVCSPARTSIMTGLHSGHFYSESDKAGLESRSKFLSFLYLNLQQSPDRF